MLYYGDELGMNGEAEKYPLKKSDGSSADHIILCRLEMPWGKGDPAQTDWTNSVQKGEDKDSFFKNNNLNWQPKNAYLQTINPSSLKNHYKKLISFKKKYRSIINNHDKMYDYTFNATINFSDWNI